jgi:2-octaprenyl-6-methoxyphenol hydroxylase
MSDVSDRCEILIVGGGLIGMSLAAATAGAGISTILAEAEAPSDLAAETPAAETYDGRASAIAYGSQRVLSGIGAWDYMQDDSEPILDIRVSDGAWHIGGESSAFVHYHFADLKPESLPENPAIKPPFGWIVENRLIRLHLMRRLKEIGNLVHLAPARVVDLRLAPGGAQATLEGGRRIASRLIIGADGRHSPVRRMAGIAASEFSYAHGAIVCTVRHEKPHRGIAHEHFLPVGPFAMLPMKDGTDEAGGTYHRSSIVWTEDRRIIPMLLELDDAALAAEIERRFGLTLGRIMPVGPRFSYPLKLVLAETYIKDGLALAGDAAHNIHPIAGQGFNMGVRDVAALAEILVDAWRLGLDIGSLAVLENYAKWRRFDNLAMVAVTDGLTRLFSNDQPLVRLARDIGFSLFNKSAPLKRLAMRHAMGIVGDLPRLVRGEAL